MNASCEQFAQSIQDKEGLGEIKVKIEITNDDESDLTVSFTQNITILLK